VYNVCLGLEYLYWLTHYDQQALRIEMTDWQGHKRWVEYLDFKIGLKEDKYKLEKVGASSGLAG